MRVRAPHSPVTQHAKHTCHPATRRPPIGASSQAWQQSARCVVCTELIARGVGRVAGYCSNKRIAATRGLLFGASLQAWQQSARYVVCTILIARGVGRCCRLSQQHRRRLRSAGAQWSLHAAGCRVGIQNPAAQEIYLHTQILSLVAGIVCAVRSPRPLLALTTHKTHITHMKRTDFHHRQR